MSARTTNAFSRLALVMVATAGGMNVEQPSSSVRGVESFDLFVKCSARSIQQIQCRPTAPQAPRSHIRANADNRKTSRPALFERRSLPKAGTASENLLINLYRTPVSGAFRRRDSDFAVCGKNLASVSRFVAGIRHASSSNDTSRLESMNVPRHLT